MLRGDENPRLQLSEILPEEDQSEYVDRLAKHILAKTQQTCCLGAWNKGLSLQAAKQFDFLLKAVTLIFTNNLEENAEKRLNIFLGLDSNRHLKAHFTQLKEKARKDGVPIRVVNYSPGKYFKPGKIKLMLPLEYYFDPALLKIVYACFPPPKFPWQWSEEIVGHLKPYLASHLHEYLSLLSNRCHSVAMMNIQLALNKKTLAQERLFINLFESGKEFESEKQRELFVDQVSKDVKSSAALFGMGNCALMTDCAMLAALAINPPFPITYIRLVSSNANVDVINAVAIGNWPQPNCVIVSPWQREGLTYCWQGDTKNTPEIPRAYDSVKVIARLNPRSAEGDKYRAMLSEQGYGDWLTKAERHRNLAIIDQFIVAFMAALQEANFIFMDKNSKQAEHKRGI